jgi:hypothetical protein
MAQINKPNDYFNTVLYTGNNTTNVITTGFQSDFVWIKRRNTVSDHQLYDSVRGVQKGLFSSLTNAEGTEGGTRGLNAFDSDGFTLGGEVADIAGSCNASGSTYASWSWLGGGTGVSNTNGSITSTVSANTTSGFSIVTYTGTGVSETIGHGLGAVPNVIIVKGKSGPDAVDSWYIYHSSVGNTQYLSLNNTGAASTFSTMWNNTTPTTTTFSTTYLSKASTNYVAYCFAEKKGFSKFGSYTGNGIDTNGTFVYTGFKPAFIITKNTISTTANWLMQTADGLNTYNPVQYGQLRPNLSNAEVTAYTTDFLSNGFKFYNDTDQANSSGQTFIYMAFAENPLVGTNNIPTTAR